MIKVEWNASLDGVNCSGISAPPNNDPKEFFKLLDQINYPIPYARIVVTVDGVSYTEVYQDENVKT